VELTVFAAASLTDALQEAATAYETAVPGTTITLSFDSSAALRTQIEQGAPVDVFLSADTRSPQALGEAGLLDGAPVGFAGNELAIVVPSDDPAGIETPADLATDGVRIVAAGEEVPITAYTTQVIENLSDLPGYPADFAAAYEANIVSREDNVRAALAKIELGEGDAAVVYLTDARSSDQVRIVEIPAEANVASRYAGAVLAGSEELAAGQAFLDWLVGPDGQAILAAYGFVPPP
jgi:molybdate transport system substrate-binding protein